MVTGGPGAPEPRQPGLDAGKPVPPTLSCTPAAWARLLLPPACLPACACSLEEDEQQERGITPMYVKYDARLYGPRKPGQVGLGHRAAGSTQVRCTATAAGPRPARVGLRVAPLVPPFLSWATWPLAPLAHPPCTQPHTAYPGPPPTPHPPHCTPHLPATHHSDGPAAGAAVPPLPQEVPPPTAPTLHPRPPPLQKEPLSLPFLKKYPPPLHPHCTHTAPTAPPLQKEPLSLPFLKKYVAFAKERFAAPELTPEASDMIAEYYADLRNSQEVKALPVTVSGWGWG